MGDDDLHVCTACGRQLQDHALAVDGAGVVVAGAYADDDTFTICCDSIEQVHPAHAPGRRWWRPGHDSGGRG